KNAAKGWPPQLVAAAHPKRLPQRLPGWPARVRPTSPGNTWSWTAATRSPSSAPHQSDRLAAIWPAAKPVGDRRSPRRSQRRGLLGQPGLADTGLAHAQQQAPAPRRASRQPGPAHGRDRRTKRPPSPPPEQPQRQRKPPIVRWRRVPDPAFSGLVAGADELDRRAETVAVLARSGVGSSRGVQWRGLSCAALAGDRRERGTSLESDGGRGTGPGPDEVAKGAAERPAFDTSVAHIARVYDYWLGGKDNFAADRAAAEQAIAAYPDIVLSVRANRAFLARAVRYLAGEAGIRQFLDIGTGIPAANNTHEVAQSVAPESRVAYVDNDPVVLAHARSLLSSGGAGATAYIDADLREPSKILHEAARTLDFSQPVAVMLVAVLHLIGPEDHPYSIVSQFMDAVPPGSYLLLSHVASDIEPEKMAEMGKRLNRLLAQKGYYRSQAEVADFFAGLDLIEPGVVPVQHWRQDSEIEG